jgi:peptide/nickel transport system ATP-binding protein/oligopeptide transport system ATP-binding protein
LNQGGTAGATAEIPQAALGQNVLEIDDLRTHFFTQAGVIRAVDGVSYAVRAGETLGVVGESGCGKSVTALSVLRLVASPPGRIVGGAVRFGGSNLLDLSESEMEDIRGNEISMIFQEPMTSLNPAHTVGAQIAEAVRLHRPVSKAAAAERALEMLRLVGVPDPRRRGSDYPHQLSGGMRQRVMIAMALSCEPRLIIADEPTTALDVTIQAQVLELLRELRDTLDMAVLLITHDLGVVAEMADDVAVMYAGRIVERGNVQDTFARPQHPYTQALLRSIPVLGMRQDQRLTVIPGMVPSPASWPSGCRFEARCDQAFDRCGEYPPLFDIGPQAAACWHRDPAAVVAEATNR